MAQRVRFESTDEINCQTILNRMDYKKGCRKDVVLQG